MRVRVCERACVRACVRMRICAVEHAHMVVLVCSTFVALICLQIRLSAKQMHCMIKTH